jgi:hypothetical protein
VGVGDAPTKEGAGGKENLLHLALGAREGVGYEKECQQREKGKGNPHALAFGARVRVKSPHSGCKVGSEYGTCRFGGLAHADPPTRMYQNLRVLRGHRDIWVLCGSVVAYKDSCMGFERTSTFQQPQRHG